ncbi:carbohydrate-binding module family 18 protein, partial [Piromyces sp. E2]
VSSNGRCGTNDGGCPSGECCSKYGWCGRSEQHCNVSEGCQSEFGKCNQDVQYRVSSNGRCGTSDGGCPFGECCSKYGWCGRSEQHCNVSEGCQSEFGDCKEKSLVNNEKKTIISPEKSNSSNHGKCGKDYGKCSDGQCCSQYGWCGKSEEYCSIDQGCQSKFGKCHKG